MRGNEEGFRHHGQGWCRCGCGTYSRHMGRGAGICGPASQDADEGTRMGELEREVRALREGLSRLTSGTKPNETRQEKA